MNRLDERDIIRRKYGEFCIDEVRELMIMTCIH
jgi:hypothetical protein